MFRTKLRLENWYEENKYLIASFVWGLLLGLLLGFGLFTPNTSPEALSKTIEVRANELTYDEEYYTRDPLTYLRYKGQQLGINEYEITKIISVMKCESGLRPDAINKNNNGTFDLGIGQINDVHNKQISRSDRLDFVKNIDFIYKLYQEQGLNPWTCAKKLGFIK